MCKTKCFRGRGNNPYLFLNLSWTSSADQAGLRGKKVAGREVIATTREQMELTRFEKIHLKNLLEDRISELHDIFLELTTNTQPGCFQKNVEGILTMIQKNFSILEKICRDLKLASEYDRNWLKRVLQDYDSWLDKPQPPKPHEHFIFSHFKRFLPEDLLINSLLSSRFKIFEYF